MTVHELPPREGLIVYCSFVFNILRPAAVATKVRLKSVECLNVAPVHTGHNDYTTVYFRTSLATGDG